MSQVQIRSITGQVVSLPVEKLPAALAQCERRIEMYNNDISMAATDNDLIRRGIQAAHIETLRAWLDALVYLRDSIKAAMGPGA